MTHATRPIWSLLALVVVGLAASPLAAAASDAEPTWSEDVAPIVYRHCVDCHRPGEVAPMSLRSYREARPWAKSIARAVEQRTMPPWHADSSQVAYANDRSLSADEIDTLVRWVRGGAPLGGEEPPPPELVEGWRLGEPDLVFRTKQTFSVPVTEEEIPYQSLTFAVETEEDLYLSGWEIRVRQPEAVHHANLVRSPTSLDGKSVGIAQAVIAGGDYVGSYLPGHNHVTYPEGVAYKLPAGSHLGIQVHYVSVGVEVEDQLSFGVHLAEGRVDQLVGVIGTDYRGIEISPGEAHYEVVDEIAVLHDLYALTSGAHMHLRGSAYTMEAVRPDGEVQLITEVPSYDFNWQSNYVLAEPVYLPAGTKLRVTSVWDNSADNPLNPDPGAWVRYGPWTDDEMINSWAHVVLANEKLGLRLEQGRIVGHFDDGQHFERPFLLQTLPGAPAFRNNEEKIRSHDG